MANVPIRKHDYSHQENVRLCLCVRGEKLSCECRQATVSALNKFRKQWLSVDSPLVFQSINKRSHITNRWSNVYSVIMAHLDRFTHASNERNFLMVKSHCPHNDWANKMCGNERNEEKPANKRSKSSNSSGINQP